MPVVMTSIVDHGGTGAIRSHFQRLVQISPEQAPDIADGVNIQREGPDNKNRGEKRSRANSGNPSGYTGNENASRNDEGRVAASSSCNSILQENENRGIKYNRTNIEELPSKVEVSTTEVSFSIPKTIEQRSNPSKRRSVDVCSFFQQHHTCAGTCTHAISKEAALASSVSCVRHTTPEARNMEVKRIRIESSGLPSDMSDFSLLARRPAQRKQATNQSRT